MDRTGQKIGSAGASYGSGDNFQRIVFNEINGADNVIVFDVSDTPQAGRANVIQAASATFTGPNSGSYNLPIGIGKYAVGFVGVDTAGRSRKVAYVTNQGASLINIYLAWPGTIVATIQPNTNPVPFETSDILTIGVPNAGAGSFSILEIFYSKPLQTDQ